MPCFESSNQNIERILRENIIMRIAKALLLLSAAMLVACSSNGSTTSNKIEESSNSVESSVTTSSEVVTSTTPTSVNTSTTSTITSSSTSSSSTSVASTSSSSSSSTTSVVSSSSSTSSQEPTPVDNTFTFSFLNPTCGAQGTKSLDAKLKEAMNTAKAGFVTSILNHNCQTMNDAPVKGSSILTIGSRSSAGDITFNLSQTIKTIVVTAETYNKTYQQGGSDVTNLDTTSVCYVNGEENAVDLKPVDGKAVTKEYTLELNSDSFQLANADETGRVFIRSITFIY